MRSHTSFIHMVTNIGSTFCPSLSWRSRPEIRHRVLTLILKTTSTPSSSCKINSWPTLRTSKASRNCLPLTSITPQLTSYSISNGEILSQRRRFHRKIPSLKFSLIFTISPPLLPERLSIKLIISSSPVRASSKPRGCLNNWCSTLKNWLTLKDPSTSKTVLWRWIVTSVSAMLRLSTLKSWNRISHPQKSCRESQSRRVLSSWQRLKRAFAIRIWWSTTMVDLRMSLVSGLCFILPKPTDSKRTPMKLSQSKPVKVLEKWSQPTS